MVDLKGRHGEACRSSCYSSSPVLHILRKQNENSSASIWALASATCWYTTLTVLFCPPKKGHIIERYSLNLPPPGIPVTTKNDIPGYPNPNLLATDILGGGRVPSYGSQLRFRGGGKVPSECHSCAVQEASFAGRVQDTESVLRWRNSWRLGFWLI